MKNRTIIFLSGLIFFATCIFSSCSFFSEEIPVPDIISFSSTGSTLDADGSSLLRIDVKISPDAIPEKREVKFTIERGTFENGQQTFIFQADSSGDAHAYVKSANPGAGFFTAEVQHVTISEQMHFDSAYPHYISVQIPQGTLAQGLNSTMDITAKLQRSIGSPTDGLWIQFTGVDSVGNIKASITSIQPSDSNDEAKAQLHLMDPLFTGRLFINAYFARGSTLISGQNIVVVE